jgi:hypothetical protein
MSNRFIVTTTISPPSEALRTFAEMKDWTLIVAGDLKTPDDEYKSLNCIYLSIKDQNLLYPELSHIIGPNCIQRRNLAMAHAYNLGAELVYLLDDDNIPLDNWGKNIYVGKDTEIYEVDCKFDVFEPYTLMGGDYSQFWARGYPHELVQKRSDQYIKATRQTIVPDLQQDMQVGNLDVDAVCRALNGDSAESWLFRKFPFSSNKFSPVNSQSTFVSRRALPWCPMFTDVGRYDDLFAMFFCQAKGFKTVYNEPTVRQKRNDHNVYQDMLRELFAYDNIYKTVKDLYINPNTIWSYVPKRTKEMFRLYQRSLN